MSVAIGNTGSLNLFQTIEIYRKTNRKHTLQNNGIIPESVTIKVIQNSIPKQKENDIDPFLVGLKRFTAEVQETRRSSPVYNVEHKRRKRSCEPVAGSEFRYAIGGSGRIAYGPTEDSVRMIYRNRTTKKGDTTSKGSSSSSSIIPEKSGRNTGNQSLSKKLSGLSLNQNSDKLDVANTNSTANDKNNAKKANSAPATETKHVVGMPPPPQQAGKFALPPSSSSCTYQRPPPPLNQKAALGVGVGGRAAAMAKMAVLQEAWAEEEDLPGMSFGKTDSLTSVGTANMTGSLKKEVVGMNGRSNKLKVAKRNNK